MSNNYKLFARKVIASGTVTAIPITYTRLSDGSAYTPVKGDCLVVFSNATKASTGNSTYTAPTGWILAAQSPAANDNGVNDTAFVMVRAADGTANDSPSITVSNTGSSVWQTATYVLKGMAANVVPSSPNSLPQTGKGGTSASTNAGVLGYNTIKPDEMVMTFLGMRVPTNAASLTWTGTTADLGLTQLGATNNFIAVGIQVQPSPATVRPVPTWVGGAGSVTTVMYVGFYPLGDQVGMLQS